MARRMVPTPPGDGKVYAMQNGKWVELDVMNDDFLVEEDDSE